MMSDLKQRLRALGQRQREYLRRKRIEAVLAYHQNRTKPNLVRLLDTAPRAGITLAARDFINECTTWGRCGLFGCPNCGKRFRRQVKIEALKKVVARCGRMPLPTEIRFVTINGPKVELVPELVQKALKRFRARLKKCYQIRLRDTSWIGFFDISLAGMLHWHGLILHPDRSARSLSEKLRCDFRETRAIKLSIWRKGKPLIENLKGVVDYGLAADRHTKVIFNKPIHGPEAVELIGKRIVCLQFMAIRGVQGLRVCWNMKSNRKWKAGVMFDEQMQETIIVPEMEALILQRRKKANKWRKWDRPDRLGLSPRKRRTDPIQGVRESATSTEEAGPDWEDIDDVAWDSDPSSIDVEDVLDGGGA